MMKTPIKLLLLFIAELLAVVAFAQSEPLPNVIIILADDLGYGELGCYGQKLIETPHIDRLAAEGMRFTQHYSGAPVCAPARCILLTGKHAGHAYIRGNDEWKERGDVWDFKAATADPGLEGQRPLPDGEVTIAEMLKGVGYTTGFIGKWGLGAPGSEGVPNNQGFDYFFGYNCQRQAHTLYPAHLWENDQKYPLDNAVIAPHQALPEAAHPADKSAYAKYTQEDYAPDVMHAKALDFLEDAAGDPFFMIYASPLPHLPLQAPERWVKHYQRKFFNDPPYPGGKGYFPCWSPRATYAAMISTLDEQVGELVAKLDALGISENTLILFTSDNGPTYTGGADTEYFQSAAPFRTDYGRGKGFLYEGGIRVPLIARWPALIEAGATHHHASAFYDYMATIADITNVEEPPASDGLSFYPALQLMTQESHEYLYWEQPEYKGQQAIRMGDWKGVVQKLHEGNTHLELYDLKNDPTESVDVSSEHPDVVSDLWKLIREAHVASGIGRFGLPGDNR